MTAFPATNGRQLDEQHWVARVRELISRKGDLRPALMTPVEAGTIRKKYQTVQGALKELDELAAVRLAYLDELDGFGAKMPLTAEQRAAAKAHFDAQHPAQTPPQAKIPIEPSTTAPSAPKPAPSAPGQAPKPSASAPVDVPALLAGQLAAQNKILTRIAEALEQMARASAPKEPNYKRPLSNFAKFDWSSIDATVTARDRDGVSAVEWSGYPFTRRAGQGKFGQAIWFSRPVGKDADGNNTYARLITFKDLTEAEPLPEKITPKGK